jgi:hypothetical protein
MPPVILGTLDASIEIGALGGSTTSSRPLSRRWSLEDGHEFGAIVDLDAFVAERRCGEQLVEQGFGSGGARFGGDMALIYRLSSCLMQTSAKVLE